MADRTFTVVLKAPSAAKFLPEETYEIISNHPALPGSFQVRVRTRWEAVGLDEPLPRELWIDVVGPAASLDEALHRFPEFARPIGGVVAFVANATVGLLDVELAFESTPGLDSRDFVQVFIPGERGIPRLGRFVMVKQLKATIEALLAANEGRLNRALGQYEQALRYWYLGGESLCLSHLWMALEALTPLVCKREMQRRETDQNGLAQAYRIDTQQQRWRDVLNGRIRQDLILSGDAALYQAAKEASNGLEHGYLDVADIHAPSVMYAEALFGHLRRTLVELLGLDAETSDFLLDIGPLDSMSMRKIIRGRFSGTTGDMAAPDQEYPILRWTSRVASAVREGHEMSFSFEEQITVVCADGVGFRGEGFEVRGRQTDRPLVGTGEVSVNQAPKPTPREQLRADALSLVNATQQACTLEGEVAISRDVHTLLAFGWFSHIFGLFEAVVATVRQKRAPEAALLAAELHEQSLRLVHFARNEPLRPALARGELEAALTVNQELADRETALTGSEPKDVGTPFQSGIDAMAYTGSPLGWPEVAQMAAEQGRERASLVLDFARSFRVATSATGVRLKSSTDERRLMSTTTDAPELDAEVLLTAVDALVHARVAWDDVVGSDNSTEIAQLIERATALYNSLDDLGNDHVP
jgi:hypothetical protein